MSLIRLPDDLVFNIFQQLCQDIALKPSEDTFCYDSNIRFILSSHRYQSLINVSKSCRKLRDLVVAFLVESRGGLQLSMARFNEVPNWTEFKLLPKKQMLPRLEHCNYLLSSYVTSLELCLNFVLDESIWSQLVARFDKITSLKILGNSEHYQRIFEYYQGLEKFHELRKLSFLLPGSSLALQGFSQCVNWSKLTQLNLFIDPYGNLAINVIEDLIDKLIFKLQTNTLQKLYLIGGNNVLFNNYTLLVKLSQLIEQLPQLTTLAVGHNVMRSPTFSTYEHRFDELFGYRDVSESIIRFFKTVTQLPVLGLMMLDLDILRHYHREIRHVFHQVQFEQRNNIELILREPTFIYPLSLEQLNDLLKLIFIIQPTKLSFKFGIQIELNVPNSSMLLIHQLLTLLTTKFNYTRIKYIDFELCWSIMEDSYIREYNDNHENKLLRWQRPQLASSVYKQLESQEIQYSNSYDTVANYVQLMDTDLVPYRNCSYRIVTYGKDEKERLKFWELACLLDDFTIFNNLGNKKGSIFD